MDLFKDKIQQVLNCLGVKDTNLAARAGIDHSFISRVKNGQRTPRKDSNNLKQLVNAIYTVADESNKLDDLCVLIGRPDLKEKVNIKSKILEFLYADKSTEINSDKLKYDNFGYRLDKVMTSFNLSNIRLAKILNIDPSLISRYRRGDRSPKSNKQLMLLISNSIFNIIVKENKRKELGGVINSTVDEVTSDTFYSWLYGMENDNEVVDKLIKIINSFNFNTNYTLVPLEQLAPNSEDNKKDNVYLGTKGLRQAVKTFLYNVINSNCKAIYLFSDQNMDWMKEPQFVMEWASLMIHCIKAGVTIHIIHNIERNMDEMLEAIAKWTPLYMSGCIIPYYSRNVYKHSGFTHTLFIAPGVATVEGWGIVGKEENITYSYCESEIIIKNSVQSYNKMLEDCGPLMKVSFNSFNEDINKVQYIIQETKNRGKCLPEEVAILKKQHGIDAKAGDYKIFNLDNIPFNDTRLIVGTDFVCVMKLEEPSVNFYIYTPAMCNALRKYAEIFIQSIGMEM